MDQDGSLNISYDEWRDYLLLAPAHDIHQLIDFWRHSTVSNYVHNMINNIDLNKIFIVIISRNFL